MNVTDGRTDGQINSYQTLWQYSDGDLLTGVKILIFDFDQNLALPSITAGPSRVNILTVEYSL